MPSDATRDLWERQGLVPLGELRGTRMADDEPDVRGWTVRTPSGARLGRVRDLLVDRRAAEVGAVLVDAEDARGDRPLVLPIDRVSLRERDRCVVARDGDALLALDDRPSGAAAAREPERESAPEPVREPVRESGRDSGGESAREPVHVAPADAASLEVTVERTADGEEVVRVPVVEERLVVQPVVTDTIVIRKRAVRDEQTVEADLRRERLDVERRGDV